MASLKSLKLRIGSVKSTQKITKAMKMVAAAKLRRAQSSAEAGRPYSTRLSETVDRLVSRVQVSDSSPRLIRGTGKDDTHLIVVVTSDRGLAGAFNTNIIRAVRRKGQELVGRGQDRPLLHRRPQGTSGDPARRPESDRRAVRHQPHEGSRLRRRKSDRRGPGRPLPDATSSTSSISPSANSSRSWCRNRTIRQIFPVVPAPVAQDKGKAAPAAVEYEPDEEAILAELLPRNFSVQLYHALLENAAGFYGSQMTAMDNATRNAGDMINRLSIQYNRQRQAAITTELVEIISGAEAL